MPKRTGWSKESPASRGYGADWRKKRKRILERDRGLCQCRDCEGGKKRTLPGTEVHHIVSRDEAKRLGWSAERTEADENLQAIHPDCHKRETAEGQGRSLQPPRRTGLDGYPIEPDVWPT